MLKTTLWCLLACVILVGCENEPDTLREQAEQAQQNLEETRDEAAELVAESEANAVEIVADARQEAREEIRSAKEEAREQIKDAETRLEAKLEAFDESTVPATTDQPAREPIPSASQNADSLDPLSN